MNTHNRNTTGDYINYYGHTRLDHYSQYNPNIQLGGESIYYKGLSAQGPDFLHNTKMNLSTVKLDVNNNAPVLMNSLIEKNKEIKALEKEIKLLNESNIYLNAKVEMLKILASNYGASQEDIEITMSNNDVFSIPKPFSNANYPLSETSLENIRVNVQEETDNLSLNEDSIVNIKSQFQSPNIASNSKIYLTSDVNSSKISCSESNPTSIVNSPSKVSPNKPNNERKRFDSTSKNLFRRSSTLLKATKSLTNGMQTQNDKHLKYLTGTRFGPSVSRINKPQRSLNNNNSMKKTEL
ncbi:hypothetical protein FG386_002217 [Cryptosporidium ryanae]|uniref:uncharacterized protein n=1 Tax=Cryptosporidium ryanae TaxID=515981 RepID=UPI00351A2D85|nr:hypothetical protein FG386_002217 [Cryptosporidium ryanae]